MTTSSILGVSIGTRSIGLAVLKNGTVLDWHIKSFKKGWSLKKLDAIIEAVIKAIFCYPGCMVAVKTASESNHNENMKLLLQRFENAVKDQGIKMHTYELSELKRSCRASISNKQDVMRHVAELYPCMYRLYEKELQNRNPYHLKVFEAILAAHRLRQQK